MTYLFSDSRILKSNYDCTYIFYTFLEDIEINTNTKLKHVTFSFLVIKVSDHSNDTASLALKVDAIIILNNIFYFFGRLRFVTTRMQQFDAH